MYMTVVHPSHTKVAPHVARHATTSEEALHVRPRGSHSKRAVLFGASLAASSSVSDRVTVNLSIGAMGFTDEYDPGRYTGTTLDGEVGLAMWSEDRAAFQPIASIGYRF